MKTSNLFAILLAAFAANMFSARAWSDTFGSGVNTLNIDFVTVGDPSNAADTTGMPNPGGSVPYSYRIGKFEISRDMVIKANAEGALAITLADMTTTGGNGADRPATGISWNEAARFVNWLNTSTGSTPAYKFAVQPGEVGYSANADIQLWTSGDAGYNANNLYRNSLARYFLPSVHEWYKAAYYNPTGGAYYNYPTGSDTAPTAVASGTTAGTAVYQRAFIAGPANITLAGGLSPYGTMGQGGNASEWEETASDLLNNSTTVTRGTRGGYWFGESADLHAFERLFGTRTSELNTNGFRVASIPEPATLCLGLLAAATFLLPRRRM